ncbi:gluconate 2-dehydrogenase subunit 3 family protein [Nakamurella sp. PAMC28650]|uniref:gluconate 2-dehydrogenase subunit 3 family protein n=1 Tax=Nakamurella sp. PAMC28650 TaxID=2762325 RepID=UPI00164E77E7|nr:gluconate 2-dehydrogenase subunit 3 family protein [Nakamurella sp. PAMC28650]QNK82938.1 gluconate 2-dehydrogenase subunit 3 family protein [Nakamurella sp. PAMC28650]
MISKADWEEVPGTIDSDSDEKLFFSVHEWDTIDAAASRIIPTDADPGAHEAGVIVFIDRYLSGIEFNFATAAGGGFLQMAGKDAVAARARNANMQRLYRGGVKELDRIAGELGQQSFKSASADVQDQVLEQLSGSPKPAPISLDSREVFHSRLQGNTDDGMPFFPTLCLHVRQGFYADPVYGGNKGQVGWRVIGFPGPKCLRDTMDGTYSTAEYFVQEYDWSELIPGFKASGG